MRLERYSLHSHPPQLNLAKCRRSCIEMSRGRAADQSRTTVLPTTEKENNALSQLV